MKKRENVAIINMAKEIRIWKARQILQADGNNNVKKFCE